MAKKTKPEKPAEGKDLEEIKREIAQKGKEIEQMQKSVEEMKAQIKSKETTGGNADLGRMVDDVSSLLNVGFGIFGASDKPQAENSKGLIGLVNELSKLSEKSQTTQKTINLGKGGVIDFRVSSHSIRDTQTPKPTRIIRISKPSTAVQKKHTTLPPTVGTIKEKEPIVDVFEEKDCLRVMAELRGVEEKEINLKVDGKTLEIVAGTSAREYYKKVELPYAVDKEIMESSYRNGILEIKLKKIKKSS